MKTYRVAVVGIGYIGVEHVKAISANPRTTLRVMVGTDASWGRLETLKTEYVAEYISPDYRAVLQDEKVDVGYLCTPNRLHADQAVAALEAGKHVFCEKPMATKLEDCRRMVATVDRTGCQLMVGHGARFQPLQQAIKALHQEGLDRVVKPVIRHDIREHRIQLGEPVQRLATLAWKGKTAPVLSQHLVEPRAERRHLLLVEGLPQN